MKITKKILISFAILSISLAPLIVSAVDTVNNPPGGGAVNIKIPNPTNVEGGLLDLLNAILNNIILPIAAVLVVLYVIYAGFTYVTARGNPVKIREANQRLLWSLIGAGILLGAVAISKVVQSTVTALFKT